MYAYTVPALGKRSRTDESDVNVNTIQHEVAAAWADGIMKGDKVCSLLHLVLSTMHPIQW